MTFSFFHKAQTSTEYLIILAVVIVIAMIVVATMGGIPGIGGGASESAVKAELASLKIGVSGYAHDSRATSFEIRNNNPSLIRIDNMSINNKRCSLYPASAKLRQGEKRKITCYGVVGLGGGDRFDYDFNITYTDMKTSAQYTMDPSVDLVGRIAEGTELHTGQTTCYVADTSTEVACSLSSVGQDAYIDGTAKSFTTKSGNVVLDDHTGLYWTSNVSSRTHPLAVTYCDGLTQGGYSDWRLPNIVELYTVMDSGSATQQGPHSDWVTGEYWSSTEDPEATDVYWYVHIEPGYFSSNHQAEATPDSVVCVRGTTNGITLTDGRTTRKSFKDLGDGTAIDEDTGLVWDKYGTSSTFAWTAARADCNASTLAGYTDWRLPTVSELTTTIDYYCKDNNDPVGSNCVGNFANGMLFNSTTEDYYYWTGTTHPSPPASAYLVYMAFGDVRYDGKSFGLYVRCVRDH
jgi:hypothetical protein